MLLEKEELLGALASGLDKHSPGAGARAAFESPKVAAHGDLLRAWVVRGAALYVCGQREGMAQGVDQALRALLGDAALAQLAADGRYRRDVY